MSTSLSVFPILSPPKCFPAKRRRLLTAFLLFLFGSPGFLLAQTQMAGSAFSERVSLDVAPLLGSPVQVRSGPLPQVSRSSSTNFSASDQVASVGVSTPLTGSILDTGLLRVTTNGTTSPTTSEVLSTSSIENVNLRLLGILTLLGLQADKIESSARLSGCGAAMVATGTTNLVNARLSGTLGLGINVPLNPAPNTVLLNLAGIRIVLNEQIATQSGGLRTLTVNAVHVTVNALSFLGIGVLSGDVTLAQSRAELSCTSEAPSSADLGVSATVTPVPGAVSQLLHFDATVSNRGPDTATGVAFTSTLPAGLTFVSATPSQGTCTGASCNLGNLASGANATIRVSTRPSQAGQLTASFAVASAVPDPSPADNSVSVTADVQAIETTNSADLSVSISATPNPGVVGQLLHYDTTVVNRGPNAATGVVLTPTLPSGLAFVSATPSQGNCSSASCNLGTLASGGSATVRVTTRPSQAGQVTTTIDVTSAVLDPSPADNTATLTTTVRPQSPGGPTTTADLSLSAGVSVDPVALDGTLTATLTLTNNGPDTASDVTLTVQVPDRLSLLQITVGQGSCTGSGPITCDLGLLNGGTSTQVRLTLLAVRVGTAIFSATATSSVPDPTPGNNSIVETLTIEVGTGGPTHPGGVPTRGSTCEIDVVPAATLLVPYFAVDLSKPTGQTTLFSVVNAKAAPKLAKVTLWTDWAVPTLSFNVYLTGYDVQTFNVRDLLAGRVPSTGTGASPQGPLSGNDVNFPGCGTGAQVAGSAALSEAEAAHVLAWHSGQPSPINGNCGGSPRPAGSMAVGYITIDAVRQCSNLTPADEGYFGPNGVATDDNTLWGDVIYVHPDNNSAEGESAVHLVADPGISGYTFYGRYVNGSAADHRRPLGTQYGVRYMGGSSFSGGTEVVVWRDTKSPGAAGTSCLQRPAWAPLAQEGILAFDEEENVELLSANSAPLAVQRLKVDPTGLTASAQFGWMLVDLSHSASLFGDVAQGWVTVLSSAEQRYSIGQRAVRLDSLCSAP